MILRIGLVLAILAASGAARAATLVTSPVSIFALGDLKIVSCVALNVGKKDVEVLIEVWGSVPITLQSFPLEPGHSASVSDNTQGARHCRFTFKGSAKAVRASLQAMDDFFTPLAIEPAR